MNALVWALVAIVMLLSASRIMSLTINYNAPVHLYHYLYQNEFQGGNRLPPTTTGKPGLGRFTTDLAAPQYNICVGKEWYRFPSNFFLPSPRFSLQFIQSNFTGQLPKPYSTAPNGTWIIPTDMNDLNKQEMSRYVSGFALLADPKIKESECHYLIDLEFPSQSEPFYSKKPNWQTIARFPFLDAEASNKFLRAFFVPSLSPKHCKFQSYHILKNTNLLK